MSTATPTRRTTGWIYDPAFLRHNEGISHPEQPARLSAVLERLEGDGLLADLTPLAFGPIADRDLERVHPRAHTDSLNAARGQYADPDTFVSEDSPEIARLAAGGAVAAAVAVCSGNLTNAFCAVRPPGHHALSDRAMGFCLYNNMAVAARAITHDDPSRKVLIVDWDAHHGNGTQAIFYEDPQVFYTSVHQYPFYPGTGAAHETGRGPGEGFTRNVPLSAGAGDREFLDGIDELLAPDVIAFSPDIVLISAGFDAHEADPLAGLNVTTEAFADATRRVCDFARDISGGRVVSILEGGYDLDALGESVAVHITELHRAAKAARIGAE